MMEITKLTYILLKFVVLRRGADKSLARSGRKQATANKLGIYSTYSPRSSVHFLAHGYNFCKPLKKKKNSEGCPSNQVRVGRKMATFQLFLQSKEQVVNRWGQIRRRGWVIKTLEAQGKPVSSGLQVPGDPGHCRARTRPPWWPSPGVFPQSVLQLHQQRWVILRVDSLALWKIINGEDAILIPKNWDENFSSGFLHSEFFGAGRAAMPPLHWLLLCLRVIVI